MRGVIMYAPGDVRVEDRATRRSSSPPTRSSGSPPPASAGPTCGPTAAPRRSTTRRWATSTSASSTRSAPTVKNVEGRRLRRRLVLRLRQHLRDLPGRLPDPLRARGSRCGATGAQAEYARIPLADGTLVATPGQPDADLIPSLLAASDVLGTGWFAAVAAEVGPGKTVAVVGDGAVGLLGVLAAKQLGAERIIAMSRHADRQALAREFGATDIVEERGDEGVARIKELTGGLGAHCVIEAVGTQESMMQAIRATRAGGHVGYVGVSHDVALPGQELFFSGVHLHGGPAPVRRFLPELIQLIWDREDRPRQGLRPHPAARGGRRGLPGHGRAPRHQGAAHLLTPGILRIESGSRLLRPDHPPRTIASTRCPVRTSVPRREIEKDRLRLGERLENEFPKRR